MGSLAFPLPVKYKLASHIACLNRADDGKQNMSDSSFHGIKTSLAYGNSSPSEPLMGCYCHMQGLF